MSSEAHTLSPAHTGAAEGADYVPAAVLILFASEFVCKLDLNFIH